MGGADVAVRHIGKLMLASLVVRLKLAGAFPGDITESAAESAKAVPPGLESDLGDWNIRVAKERFGPLDPARQQIAVRWEAECILERSGKMGLGHSAHSRQPWARPRFMRSGVYSILGAKQAAQQPRVLACARRTL